MKERLLGKENKSGGHRLQGFVIGCRKTVDNDGDLDGWLKGQMKVGLAGRGIDTEAGKCSCGSTGEAAWSSSRRLRRDGDCIALVNNDCDGRLRADGVDAGRDPLRVEGAGGTVENNF